MKQIVWLLAAGILIFLISCSNPQASVLTAQEDTLRNELEEKSKDMAWTAEIEADRLSSELNNKFTTTDKEFISPQMLNSIKELQPAIYPQIKDFASLDSSAMNSSLLNVLNNFCSDLCKGTDNLQNYFYSKYFFNYVFFKNDFEQIVDELKKDDLLFENYVICKTFENQDLTQVPVRFYNNKDYIDLSVYLAYHSGYKVTQIEVIRWGKLYGESDKEESKE